MFAAVPQTMGRTCIVHLVRHALHFCSWKDGKVVVVDLRWICSAPAWRRAWAEVVAVFGFEPAAQKL